MSKELRYYQRESINAVKLALNRGVNKCLLVLATGTGKTFTTIKLIEELKFKRVLWLSDRETLVSQSGLAFVADKFDSAYHKRVEEKGFLEWVKSRDSIKGDYTIGAIKADLWVPDANIVMGSLQTIHRRLDKLPTDYFDCIVCDEAHNFAAKTAVTTINHFTPKLLIGLTGTPERLDGLQLSDIFQEIVYEYDISHGIKDRFLCELEGIRVKTKISLDKVHALGGEFNQGELVQEVNTPERNKLIVDSFIKYCGDRQAIGYAVNIQHAVDLANIFNDFGIRAVAISSNEELTPDSMQKLKDYGNKKYQVVWNVGLIVAGYDNPETGVIIHARPTKSTTFFLQGVGRCTRLKSKEYIEKYGQRAIVLDIVDNTTRHNLINTWSLDKGLKTEDRVFTTREQKDAILAQIEARKATMEVKREVDERVNLLTIPKAKISKSFKMSEDATPAQLAVIQRWGYDIKNTHYTKHQISEIFGKQPASYSNVLKLKAAGYDVEGKFISVAEAQLAEREIEKRNLSKLRQKNNL